MTTGTADQFFSFRSILAVCAHPDDESFGLGAVLSACAGRGVKISVLCFTHGEASTLGTVTDLANIRAEELGAAATVLGARSVRLMSYPDGQLSRTSLAELCDVVEDSVAEHRTDCLVVFDEGGITGHPDHQRATEAAVASADRLGLPVLAWALPSAITAVLNDEFSAGFVGREPFEIDVKLEVDRTLQHEAISCHASQSSDNPVLRRRLALQGATESLRWLRAPDRSTAR